MISAGQGPVKTLIMSLDHQEERTHLFALPRELLVLVFKAQSSIIDAGHLAATCHYFRNLYKSENTIARTVLQREIPCYEVALKLAEAQFQNLQLRHSEEIYLNAEDAARVYRLTSSNFTALISKIYLNAKDADRVYRLASSHFTAKPHVSATSTCHIHSSGSPNQREILPYERMRILDSWYFLKLRAESLKIVRWQDHQSVPQEFWAISLVQAYVLWSMGRFVCEDMDFNFQEELGLVDLIDNAPGIQVPESVFEWDSTRDNVAEVYSAKRNRGPDEYKKQLNGPCDLCPLPDGAVCESREPGKSIWEL